MSSCGALRRAPIAGRTSSRWNFRIGARPLSAACIHCRLVRPRPGLVMSNGGWLKKVTSLAAIFFGGEFVSPTTSAVTSTV